MCYLEQYIVQMHILSTTWQFILEIPSNSQIAKYIIGLITR